MVMINLREKYLCTSRQNGGTWWW